MRALIRVMVVEDEPPILNSICKLIKSCGEEIEIVCTAINGIRALEYIKKNPVDIVFSDIKMPVMDGIELAKELHSRVPQVQVILISGFQEFGLAREAIHYGVKDYLLKPVSRECVYEALTAGVHRAKARQAEELLREKRGGPEGAEGPRQNTLCERAAEILRSRYRENLSMRELAEQLGCSPTRLSKKFREAFGLSISEYVNEYRIGLACSMLKRDKELKMKEVAFALGFSDQYYFSKTFKKIIGKWPTEYIKEL